MVFLASCRGGERELPVVGGIPHGIASATTLHVDADGRFWIGGAGGLTITNPEGRRRVAWPTPEPARAVGLVGDRLYAAAGGRLAALDARTGEPIVIRDSAAAEVVLPDVRGRWIFRAVGRGAVLAHDAHTLEPVWGWAARGDPTSAMAGSPEGDILYQALASGESGGAILARDVQTGRIVWEEAVSARVHAVTTASNGDLLLAAAEGGRTVALRLRPRAGTLEPVWRRTLGPSAGHGATLRYAPGAERIALLAPENNAGLHVLDAETGGLVGSLDEAPVDAAFAPGGVLYLLYPRDVRRVALP